MFLRNVCGVWCVVRVVGWLARMVRADSPARDLQGRRRARADDFFLTTFFPEVPVIFAVDGTVAHCHIPLLLRPYGFSTYRSN